KICGHCIYGLERPCMLRQYEVTFVHDGCAICGCAKCECEISLHINWFSKPYCDHIAEAVEAIHYCAGNCNGCGTTNDEVATCGVDRTAIDPLREINFHFGWRTTRGADAVSKDRFGNAVYERSLFTCGDGTIAMIEY